jgi:hypothetical protein
MIFVLQFTMETVAKVNLYYVQILLTIYNNCGVGSTLSFLQPNKNRSKAIVNIRFIFHFLCGSEYLIKTNFISLNILLNLIQQ